MLDNPCRDEERGRQLKPSQDFKYPRKRSEGPIPAEAESFGRPPDAAIDQLWPSRTVQIEGERNAGTRTIGPAVISHEIHLCLPEVQAKPRTDPWIAARRARGSANRPSTELSSPVKPGSCQAQVRDPPTAQFFPVPKGWDDAAPLASLHTLDDYREIPQTGIETKIHHSNYSLVQISNIMVTRSHSGDGGRPLDGRPNPSERRCSACSAAGWRANRARYDVGKTLAALRGPPEDAVGLASIEIIETPWAPRSYSQPGRRLRAGMEELKRTCRILGDVRGIRLMNSIEIIDLDTGTPSRVLAAIISQHTLANRLFVSHRLSGTVGGHNIRLPPDRDAGPDRPLPDCPGRPPASSD